MTQPPSAALVSSVFYGPAIAMAALFLLARDGVPAIAALFTGRIRSKSAAVRYIERDAEPERFHALVGRRLLVGLSGFGFCVVVGLWWIARNADLDRLMP
jgi:hypothetical protein